MPIRLSDLRRAGVRNLKVQGESRAVQVERPQVQARAQEPKTRGEMNGWERKYADRLDAMKHAGEIRAWRYEAIRVRLADGAYYCPDFYIVLADGLIRFVEIKGFKRSRDVVRFKFAREQFPEFDWRMLTLKGSEFVEVM